MPDTKKEGIYIHKTGGGGGSVDMSVNCIYVTNIILAALADMPDIKNKSLSYLQFVLWI